jgi:hypothetical protein
MSHVIYWAGGVAQVVEGLPRKLNAKFKPSTTKTKQKSDFIFKSFQG